MRARRGLRTRPVAEVRTCTRARGPGARPVAEVQTCARPPPMSAPRCGGAARVRIRARAAVRTCGPACARSGLGARRRCGGTDLRAPAAYERPPLRRCGGADLRTCVRARRCGGARARALRKSRDQKLKKSRCARRSRAQRPPTPQGTPGGRSAVVGGSHCRAHRYVYWGPATPRISPLIQVSVPPNCWIRLPKNRRRNTLV